MTTTDSSRARFKRAMSRVMVIGSPGRSWKCSFSAPGGGGSARGGAFRPAPISPSMKSGNSTPSKWWWLMRSVSLVA